MYGKLIKPGAYISTTYRIKSELGTGGSGAVYLAWHTRLRKHVVIKVSVECIGRAIETHRNEVEALKNIKSLFVPQVLDFIVDKDFGFTIMEYIEGESFDKVLRAGREFTDLQVIGWYIQLADALEAIHRHDVCHRDIKPSNIMLAKNGDVCLIDFNSAFVKENNTGVISRSMGYASPEQYKYFKLCKNQFVTAEDVDLANGETDLMIGSVDSDTALEKSASCTGGHNIDWKLSDIYSLGATMLHFLIGKRPPVKTEEVANISKISGYNEEILKVIEKSMKENPAERYTSAKELQNALELLQV